MGRGWAARVVCLARPYCEVCTDSAMRPTPALLSSSMTLTTVS
jgi:hypothetical protein